MRRREEGLGERGGNVTVAPNHGVQYSPGEGERECRHQGQPAQASKGRSRHVFSPLSVDRFTLLLDHGSNREKAHRPKVLRNESGCRPIGVYMRQRLPLFTSCLKEVFSATQRGMKA